jgi:hypothetical protein
MPTMKQYSDHNWCIEQLKKAQEADHDMREQAREAHLFANKRDGQWEPRWWEASDGKPRYSFDMVNPIIDQVTGAIDRQDFSISVAPAGGEATEDLAQVYDGLIRNIENMSNAGSVYDKAASQMVICGLDGWRVSQSYVDDDAFDQDLVIERIGNYIDRVWLGPSQEPDGSDARYGWILTGMDKEEFRQKYPEASEAGVDSDRTSTAYFYRQDLTMVGEFLYMKPVERELVLMNNGRTYEVGPDFKQVVDDLAELQVTEVRRRKRTKYIVCTRLFDANGWLDKPKETVFQNWLPIIPCYANFKFYEDKVTYWGVVEKLIDPQRVMNYAMSREVEEGALAPRAKFLFTPEQAEGHEEELGSMNVNTDPFQAGGAQINPGLRSISESMRQIIGMTAGMFAANMGDNPGLQSGVAIEALQDRGDTGNNKYVQAREISQRHTARILVNAIPRVYEPGRQVRILGEDGSYEMKTVGDQVIDNETGQMVVLNDLSQGRYDVTCHSGPSFQNRQSETVNALTELGKVDPSFVEIGGDILAGNITSPGMDDIQGRKRQQLFQAGIIPQDQMTEEEMAMLQQMQQQPPQEDPNMVLARAEHEKAMADHLDAQNKAQQIQQEGVIKVEELKLERARLELEAVKVEIDKAKALAEVKGKAASAAKALSEAEAQDIENDAAMAGITQLAEMVNSGAG